MIKKIYKDIDEMFNDMLNKSKNNIKDEITEDEYIDIFNKIFEESDADEIVEFFFCGHCVQNIYSDEIERNIKEEYFKFNEFYINIFKKLYDNFVYDSDSEKAITVKNKIMLRALNKI